MNTLSIAEKILLAPAGITESQLLKVFGKLCSQQIDIADLYFQATWQENWSLEDGLVKEAHYNSDKGVGVRAVSGEKTGFAYSDDIILPAIEQAAASARYIAQHSGEGVLALKKAHPIPSLYSENNPLDSFTAAQKIALLKECDLYARSLDPRVRQVMISLSALHEVILILNNDQELCADIRPLVRMNVQVIVEENGRREQGSMGGGGRVDYNYFIEQNHAKHYVEEAVRCALLQLKAQAAPAGLMPVVLGPGWPGVLLHEAIGHGLEGDFNRKGTSAFANRLGERVASPACTVVDDGTLANRRGSLTIDDEGTPTERTVLIENGILKNYLQDKQNAKLMNMKPTGNGRRESYASCPLPRMTNTYMLAGAYAPEEIIKSVKKGLYAVNFSGGQVDITSGKFVFTASEAYMIENGKITYPVKGASIIGDGPEVLTKVNMVGNNLELDTGVGTCGKEGQSVPVGVGQPTLKIDEIVVGGTQ